MNEERGEPLPPRAPAMPPPRRRRPLVAAGTIAGVVTASASVCNTPVDDALSSYFAEAHPTIVGTTGLRSFGMDQRGTIFQDNSGVTFTNVFPATATPVQ